MLMPGYDSSFINHKLRQVMREEKLLFRFRSMQQANISGDDNQL